jgi:Lipopolysaccharide-assembly
MRETRAPIEARKRHKTVAGALLLSVAVLGSSCAYTTSTAQLPTHLRSVAVPVFENTTAEYNLEQDVTAAVIERFVQDNHLKVVDERAADCVVRGKIIEYRNSVFGIQTTNDLSQEYRVTIGVEVVFKDLVKNREVWNDKDLVKTSNYYVQDVPGHPAQTEIDGRKAAILKLADEIFSRSVESW